MGRMKTSWVRWASAEVWVQMGAYCADKRGNVALILMWCTLILSIHIYRFSLSVHFSFIFIFPLLHTIFISTSRFFLVLSQHICPLSLCPSLWLKFSLPDWKVSTLPKAEKGLEASSPFVAHHHLPNGQRWLNPDFLACSRYPHPVQCSLLSLQLGRTIWSALLPLCPARGWGSQADLSEDLVSLGHQYESESTALSSQITSEHWTTYFLHSQHLFQLPTWLLLSRGWLSGLEPGSWLVICFPLAREEFPEDKWYAGYSQGNWGAPKPNQQTGPGKASHMLSAEERNVCGNWE